MTPVFSEIVRTLLFLPIFLLLTYFLFYVPGFLILGRSKNALRDDENIVLSVGTGLVIFLLLSILFSFLKIRFLMLPFYFGLILYTFFKFKKQVFSALLGLFKQKWLMIFLLLGTMVEGMINFPSSFPFRDGHLYWSAQAHDGLWHIAVIEQLKQHLPAANPLFAGEKLYNYHFFSDIVTAQFNQIFSFFSPLDLYFRYFSFLLSFLMGLSIYSFLHTWKKNKTIGVCGIFFTYFVGSFGYLILLIQNRGFFGGEAIFWAAQTNTIIGNPPHAFCYILISTFLLSFYHYLKSKEVFFFLLCLLLGSFLVGFKVSGAFVLIAGLGVSALLSLLTRKNRSLLVMTTILGLGNLLTFKSITKAGESLLIFQPWYFIRSMVVAFDRVNWVDLELRRQFYLAKGGIRATLRVIQFETIAFLMFLFGNIGMRFIGFWEIGKSIIKKTIISNPLETTLFVALWTGFLIPIFFIQHGVPYVLIQFMEYFLLFFGYYAAVTLYKILERIKRPSYKILFLSFFIFLSIPTVIGNLVEFYGHNPLVVVENEELAALTFLKNNSKNTDIVLTKPFDKDAHYAYKTQPWPIHVWSSTAYVSAYTGRQSYVANEGQLIILGIDPKERVIKANAFFSLNPSYDNEGRLLGFRETNSIPDPERINFLKEAKINFIYLRQEETSKENKEFFEKIGLEQIFTNPAVIIYKVSS